MPPRPSASQRTAEPLFHRSDANCTFQARGRAAPMHTMRVNLKGGVYDVVVGPELLTRTGELMRGLGLGRRVAVVTHPALVEIHGYAPLVVSSLRDAGYEVCLLCVPPGEESKSLAHATGLCRDLVRAGMDRGSSVLALGGGVIGDLAGFVAATLFRGIAFVNVPTTLLAQVDSSVGGKTGVNLPEGKNLVGTFHQPRLVVADVTALRTLAARDFRSGLAEIVKHAMIADADLFRTLEDGAERLLACDAVTLEAVIARNCAIKARVVEQDEREAGLRAVLNFGHTVGHAVEAASGYGAVTHGEAVAFGMLVATRLSVRRGLCAPADATRLESLLHRLQLLPRAAPKPETLETYVLRDKKVRDGVLQFVLTLGIGGVTLAPVSDRKELLEALQSVQA